MNPKTLIPIALVLGLLVSSHLIAADCPQAKPDRYFPNPEALLAQLVPAVEKGDAIALNALVACEINVGPWESEFSSFSPAKAAVYLAAGRRKGEAVKDLLPFQVLRKEGNNDTFLIAMKGFKTAPGDPIANNVRVIGLQRRPLGWTWSSVLEVSEKELPNVYSLNFPKP
jgi:hypothetical protein